VTRKRRSHREEETLEVRAPRNLRPGLVSIGFPVYNGALYLREAIESLIAQEYQDIEIIISDNASTDKSKDICREYTALDARIRLYESDRNRGTIWNFVRVYELARGEYFMWAAHDDRRHAHYLGRCVAALQKNPRAVFCCTGVRLIDVEGNDVSDAFPFKSYHPTGPTPGERLRALVRSGAWFDTYSLIRTRALKDIRFGAGFGGDVVLIAELCLRGEVEEVPEKLFDYRYFPAKTEEDIAQILSTAGTKVSPSWTDLAADLMAAVQRAPLSLPERLRLKWMVAVEFCLRNPTVGVGVHREGFEATRRAINGGEYRRAVTLAAIGLLTQTVRLGERIAYSTRDRSSKLMGALFTRQHIPSASKRD